MTKEEQRIVEDYQKALTYDPMYNKHSLIGMKYDQRIIDFFKKHNLYEEEMFKVLQANTWGICFADPDMRARIGCPYINVKGKLLGFLIVIPDKTNDFTMFCQVHEIAHGIYAYKHLGKRVDDVYHEVLPFIVEKLYAEDIADKRIDDYSKYLDTKIDENAHEKYKFALYARKELLEGFDGDVKKLDGQSRRLLKKYSHEHK